MLVKSLSLILMISLVASSHHPTFHKHNKKELSKISTFVEKDNNNEISHSSQNEINHPENQIVNQARQDAYIEFKKEHQNITPITNYQEKVKPRAGVNFIQTELIEHQSNSETSNQQSKKFNEFGPVANIHDVKYTEAEKVDSVRKKAMYEAEKEMKNTQKERKQLVQERAHKVSDLPTQSHLESVLFLQKQITDISKYKKFYTTENVELLELNESGPLGDLDSAIEEEEAETADEEKENEKKEEEEKSSSEAQSINLNEVKIDVANGEEQIDIISSDEEEEQSMDQESREEQKASRQSEKDSRQAEKDTKEQERAQKEQEKADIDEERSQKQEEREQKQAERDSKDSENSLSDDQIEDLDLFLSEAEATEQEESESNEIEKSDSNEEEESGSNEEGSDQNSTEEEELFTENNDMNESANEEEEQASEEREKEKNQEEKQNKKEEQEQKEIENEDTESEKDSETQGSGTEEEQGSGSEQIELISESDEKSEEIEEEVEAKEKEEDQEEYEQEKALKQTEKDANQKEKDEKEADISKKEAEKMDNEVEKESMDSQSLVELAEMTKEEREAEKAQREAEKSGKDEEKSLKDAEKATKDAEQSVLEDAQAVKDARQAALTIERQNGDEEATDEMELQQSIISMASKLSKKFRDFYEGETQEEELSDEDFEKNASELQSEQSSEEESEIEQDTEESSEEQEDEESISLFKRTNFVKKYKNFEQDESSSEEEVEEEIEEDKEEEESQQEEDFVDGKESVLPGMAGFMKTYPNFNEDQAKRADEKMKLDEERSIKEDEQRQIMEQKSLVEADKSKKEELSIFQDQKASQGFLANEEFFLIQTQQNDHLQSTGVQNFADLTDAEMIERIKKAATAESGTPKIDLNDPSNNPTNVKRVMRVFSQDQWDDLFSFANKVYSYEEFLRAVAKFPMFCNEKPKSSEHSCDDMCRKELSTVFAHNAQETGANAPEWGPTWKQALYWLSEMGCPEASKCPYDAGCQTGRWTKDAYPCKAGEKYYGRGAKQLSYNYNYGPYSRVMYGDIQVLLDNPDKVATEGMLATGSAFWFYMTPQSPKPSMHDIVTEFWVPNDADSGSGIKKGFGATTNVINGGVECSKGYEVDQSKNRMSHYKNFMKYFGLEVDTTDELGCANQKSYPDKGAGYQPLYYDQSWDGSNKCKPVFWMTTYSVLFDDDFEACNKKYFG